MNLIALLMMAAAPSDQPLPDVVLLDFTASYCKHCQDMAPALQRMERSGFPIQEIDTTQHPDVTRQYRVDRLPTFVLVVEGEEVRRFVGLTAERELRRAMNDAAEKLDMRRRAEMARSQPPKQAVPSNAFEEFEEVQNEPAAEPMVAANDGSKRSGIGGFFNRMRDGLTGRRQPEEPAEVRGQSPDSEVSVTEPLPKQATVRVHLADGKMRDVGTGTIVHSTEGQSTILTCAHIFKEVSTDAKVRVEVFTPGEILTYAATVVGGNHESDLAFLQIKNRNPLPMVPLQPGALNLKQNETLYSYGCDGGAIPSLLTQRVAKVNHFEGAENIVVDVAPVQGRSGGGLFNSSGELVGVCSGAFRQAGEGLYTGVGAVRQLMAQLQLNFSSSVSETTGFADAEPEADPREIPNPFAAAEEEADPFAELFDENEPAEDEIQLTESVDSRLPPEFDDARPAGSKVVPVAMTAAARSNAAVHRSAPSETEVTVIISDPVKGRRVVVIPKASPWLLELLTGESANSGAGTATVSARQQQVSATSNRQSAQKPAAPTH